MAHAKYFAGGLRGTLQKTPERACTAPQAPHYGAPGVCVRDTKARLTTAASSAAPAPVPMLAPTPIIKCGAMARKKG
jgi:hypothetical protein